MAETEGVAAREEGREGKGVPRGVFILLAREAIAGEGGTLARPFPGLLG